MTVLLDAGLYKASISSEAILTLVTLLVYVYLWHLFHQRPFWPLMTLSLHAGLYNAHMPSETILTLVTLLVVSLYETLFMLIPNDFRNSPIPIIRFFFLNHERKNYNYLIEFLILHFWIPVYKNDVINFKNAT